MHLEIQWLRTWLLIAYRNITTILAITLSGINDLRGTRAVARSLQAVTNSVAMTVRFFFFGIEADADRREHQ